MRVEEVIYKTEHLLYALKDFVDSNALNEAVEKETTHTHTHISLYYCPTLNSY